jgi:hypothetical protein
MKRKKRRGERACMTHVIIFFNTGMAFGEKGTDLIKEDHYL